MVTLIFILHLHQEITFNIKIIMDIKKLKSFQLKLNKLAKEETNKNAKENLLNIVLEDDIRETYRNGKERDLPELSKRVLSHWVKKGLIEAEQSKEGGWYYFNRVEKFWIKIITQLREFGVELDKIKRIREQLFSQPEDVNGFYLIEFAIIYSVLKKPYIMIVFDDGEIRLMTSELYGKYIAEDALPPHITFNFFHLANEMFPNNKFELLNDEVISDNMTTEEQKLLYYLKTGDYDNIKVRLKDGDVYYLECTMSSHNPKTIHKILNEGAYQDIQIKKADGKIVFIECTDKIKLK